MNKNQKYIFTKQLNADYIIEDIIHKPFTILMQWYPMDELPDGHEEYVLVAYKNGKTSSVFNTHRALDETFERVAWMKFPPHPNTIMKTHNKFKEFNQ